MFGPFKILLLVLALSTARAAPTTHTKRIAQVIADSTQKWEAACVSVLEYGAGAIYTNSDWTWLFYSSPRKAETSATLSP